MSKYREVTRYVDFLSRYGYSLNSLVLCKDQYSAYHIMIRIEDHAIDIRTLLIKQ